MKIKPHIKDIYTPFITEDKIVFGTMAEAIEIDNDDEDICDLVKLLAGDYTLDEIYLQSKLSKENIDEIIQQFDELNLIENMQVDTQSVNTDRYKTNLNYFSFYGNLQVSAYEFQSRLNRATVALLGIGGSTLTALNLVGMGVGKIIIVDYDTIELSNLSRQLIFTEDDIGLLKVDAAKRKLQQINGDVEIITHNMKVVNSSDLSHIIAESDIVINSIDTPPIQAARWVNYVCMQSNKVLIQGGLTANSMVLDVFSKDTGCYDCFLLASMQTDSNFEKQLKFVLSSNFENVNTSFAPNVSMLTGIITSEATRLITGYQPRLINNMCVAFSVSDFSSRFINSHVKQAACPTCGQIHSIGEPVDIERLIELAKTL